MTTIDEMNRLLMSMTTIDEMNERFAHPEMYRTITDWNNELKQQVKYGSMKCVRTALDAGADVNTRTVEGDTVLHALFINRNQNYLEMAKLLIKAGANVNLPNTCGVTPLASAVVVKCEAAVKMLIAAGADVNVVIHGKTLLHHTKNSTPEIRELLIAAGAHL